MRSELLSKIPEAVQATNPAGGVIADGDWCINFGTHVRVTNAEFARGWNEARTLAAGVDGVGAVGVEHRMWDSQWVNVVNHERAYEGWDKEEAVNHAVKLTEKAMAKNVRDGKWPPAREGGGALSCGHPASLMLRSAETGQHLYCELCDAITCARDNASDAASWREKHDALQADAKARQWLDTMRDLLLPKHAGEWREFVAMVKASDSGVEFKDCRTRTAPECITQPQSAKGGKFPILSWWCPQCGGAEVSRERRPNGNAKCENGHAYPMSERVWAHNRPTPPTPSEHPAVVASAEGGLIPKRDAPAEELWAAIYRLNALAYRVDDKKPWMHVAAQLRMEAKPQQSGEGMVTVAWFDGFDLITDSVMQSRADGMLSPPRDLSKYRPLVYKESAK